MNKTCKDFNVKLCNWCSNGDDLWSYELCEIICWKNCVARNPESHVRATIKMYTTLLRTNELFYLKIAIDNYFPQYKDKVDKLFILI